MVGIYAGGAQDGPRHLMVTWSVSLDPDRCPEHTRTISPGKLLNPTLIALDAGTTGVTACLFDSDLRLLQRSYSEIPQSFPQPGRVEHAAEDILRGVDRVLGELTATIEAQGLGMPAALGPPRAAAAGRPRAVISSRRNNAAASTRPPRPIPHGSWSEPVAMMEPQPPLSAP